MVDWRSLLFGCLVVLGCGPDAAPSGDTESDGGSAATSGVSTSGTLTSGPSGTGVDCPVGAPGCACTEGGSCDGGLECIDGTCSDPDCPVGSEGCSCTGGGTCDEGLSCDQGLCVIGGDDDTATTTGDIDLGEWTRRRAITVTNASDVALSDFQVRATIDYDEDMNTDFSDLRFTDAGEEPIPHWVEHSVSPAFAEVWVRVPSIRAMDSATIYVYYGNPMAESGSNGNATFSFFDHFDDELDAETWVATGETSVASSRLTIATGSVYTNDLVFEPNQWVEINASWENLKGERTGLRIGESQGVAMGFASQDATLAPMGVWCSVCDGSGECSLFEQFGSFDPLMVGVLGLALTDESNLFAYDRGEPLTHDAPWVGSNFVILGNPYGSDAGVMESFDMVIDWVLVREWTALEPTTAVGAEEEL